MSLPAAHHVRIVTGLNLSCRSVLSVTLVYCSHTVGWIRMPLGLEVGLRPGHIVLDGDLAPLPQRSKASQFSAHVCLGQTAGWIKMPLGREVGLRPRRHLFVTFCVSRRRRKMYCGHARLCVCLSVYPRPYAHTTARTRM